MLLHYYYRAATATSFYYSPPTSPENIVLRWLTVTVLQFLHHHPLVRFVNPLYPIQTVWCTCLHALHRHPRLHHPRLTHHHHQIWPPTTLHVINHHPIIINLNPNFLNFRINQILDRWVFFFFFYELKKIK